MKHQAFKLGDDAANKQYRSVVSFDTSSLPDNAIISKITLKIKRNSVTGGATFAMFQGLLADVKKGYFGAKTGLELNDFQSIASKTSGPFSPALIGGWYSMDLTGAKAYINKLTRLGGVTQIRLRFKLGDNDNRIANFMSFSSGNAATGKPELVITYSVP